MNKNIVFWAGLWLTGPLVLVGAWLDKAFLGIHSYRQYVVICSWEYIIFLSGLGLGLLYNYAWGPKK